jgi:hypothetical protein
VVPKRFAVAVISFVVLVIPDGMIVRTKEGASLAATVTKVNREHFSKASQEDDWIHCDK